MEDFSPSERRTLRSLSTPEKIQDFLYGLDYHLADSAISPREVLRQRTAHCLEGALFAAAALRVHGHPPLILDMEAENDSDHVIAVFRRAGAWGAVAVSNYSGCRYRAPVYRSLRELALSYFNDYFNLRRQRSLRTFSTRPVNLRRFDRQGWMTHKANLWFIVDHLFEVPHTKLLTPAMARSLARVDERGFRAGSYGMKVKKAP